MRVAQFKLMDRTHVVLVVDERYVLDNVYSSVQSVERYERFDVTRKDLPETLMAEGRPGSAAVGR
jgi:hypothetical protein